MDKGEHNNLNGLLEIFSLRAILNKGLPDIIKAEYPEIIPAIEPKFEVSSTPSEKRGLSLIIRIYNC